MAPGDQRRARRVSATGEPSPKSRRERGVVTPQRRRRDRGFVAPKPRSGESGLRVSVVDGLGRDVRAAALTRWLVRVAPASARGTVTVAFVSDERIRALNRAYRAKNYATDVLSFPANSPARRTSSASSVVERFLGDIVIAAGVARRQARDAGHDELTEHKILALHGLLHLLGYDHEHDDGRMARVERRLRRRGGLEGGLIERAARA